MKTKNKIIGWLFAGALAIAGVATAQFISVQHKSPSFINGCNILIPNNTVYYNGYTNIEFIDKRGAAMMSFSNNVVYYTNANGTTSNVMVTGNCFSDVPMWSDALGNVSSNVTLTIMLNSTNYFLPGIALPNPNNNFGPQYNAGVLTNSAGNPLTSVIYTNVPTATSTNLLTFVFVKTGDGDYASYGNMNGTNSYPYPLSGVFDTNSTWSVVINNTFYTANSGANPLVVVTNVPAWFMAGAKAIRLYSVTSGSGGNTAGQILNICKFSGWY